MFLSVQCLLQVSGFYTYLNSSHDDRMKLNKLLQFFFLICLICHEQYRNPLFIPETTWSRNSFLIGRWFSHMKSLSSWINRMFVLCNTTLVISNLAPGKLSAAGFHYNQKVGFTLKFAIKWTKVLILSLITFSFSW